MFNQNLKDISQIISSFYDKEQQRDNKIKFQTKDYVIARLDGIGSNWEGLAV